MGRPLYQQIQQDIVSKIHAGELSPGDLVPSEKELAEKYGVSQMTTKNAIKGLVEEGLLVRYRGKGTFVRQSDAAQVDAGRTKTGLEKTAVTIALILPSMKTRIDQRLLDSLEKHCAEAGYELIIRITRESPEEEAAAIERFRMRGVHGFIVFPVEQDSYNETILRLSLDRVPLVLVDRFLKEIKTYSVSSDNMGGVREAVSGLIGKGHRRIAYLTPEITNTATDERARGCELAFTDHQLPIDKSLWCTLKLETLAEGKGLERIQAFFEGQDGITAVFAVNAELARYAHQLLRKRELAEPAAEIVAFDESELEHVSYIEQQIDEMGRLTVELLAEQLQGRYEPRREVVPVQIVWK
ncbi:GntR family transcriptional regulator [Paenibacillus soyae]|uniref:GntR family transcriptional regulator n=1 Tax=Paenibacillus soyae TaxID=2969249 RepID=A0A9X2MPH1_9BACL|nr:GntR family transcriptional regulator [Paenibacillus soyae]MCR2803837.1 GntR family transcriptional regulator [Paenibacillus soyae]